MSISRIVKYITVAGMIVPLSVSGIASEKLGKAGQREVPPGLLGTDAADFNHLSEGADIYPYEWLMALKSQTTGKKASLFEKGINFITRRTTEKSPFLSDLDKKFGVIVIPKENYNSELKTKVTVNGKEEERHYLMPFVGITATWSDKKPQESDAFSEDTPSNNVKIKNAIANKPSSPLYQEVIDRNLNPVKSIRMVGTNCSLCHSSEIQINKTGIDHPLKIRMDGAPNMLDIRGYFKDMMASTIALFTNEKEMTGFLKRLHVPNAQTKAKELINEFQTNFGLATSSLTDKKFFKELAKVSDIEKLSTIITLLIAKEGTELKTKAEDSGISGLKSAVDNLLNIGEPTERLYKGSAAIAASLESLLRVTYGFTKEDKIGELKDRMRFLGGMMVGNNPLIKESIAGFGRTDAFGRISNMVLRGNNPVDLTGEVSYPWIWGIKYKAMLHYNGNTNSVVLRNMGQSLGLGAVVRSDGTPTSNVYNLNRLENLVHKIQFPQWHKVFADVAKEDKSFEINSALLPTGKTVYLNKCAGCHEANKLEHFVGPGKGLRNYKTISFKTDYTTEEGHEKARKGQLDIHETDPMTAINATLPITDAKGSPQRFQDVIYNAVSGLKTVFFDKYNYTEDVRKEYAFESLRGKEFFRDTLYGFTEEDQKSAGNDYGKIKPNSGYIAKSLSGVWATAPYLHNGSVPSIAELLKPANQRPKTFNVQSRLLDPKTLGYVDYDRQNNICSSSQDSTCFDTSKIGNSNSGHEYGTDLTKEDKEALIEYLKVLAPDVEYSWEYGSRADDNQPN